jgi:hypothetical protein
MVVGPALGSAKTTRESEAAAVNGFTGMQFQLQIALLIAKRESIAFFGYTVEEAIGQPVTMVRIGRAKSARS